MKKRPVDDRTGHPVDVSVWHVTTGTGSHEFLMGVPAKGSYGIREVRFLYSKLNKLRLSTWALGPCVIDEGVLEVLFHNCTCRPATAEDLVKLPELSNVPTSYMFDLV